MKEEAGIDVRKFRKGDTYVDSLFGHSKMEVLDVENQKVKLRMTWFDPCIMGWKSEVVDTDQKAYFTEIHFRPRLVESKEEEESFFIETNKAIENYRKLYGIKNRCDIK